MSRDAMPLSFEIDLRLFRLVSIQKAAHRLSGNFRITFNRKDDHFLVVNFAPKPVVNVAGSPVLADFETELLDQELRESVASETQAIRNLILAQAFSAANLIDPTGESAEFQTDPLFIARQDEEH